MPDGYDLIRSLGRGGFGEVWLAVSKVNSERVAIKFLYDLTEDRLVRFRREIRLLTEHVNNRFVVNIFGYDLDAARPYIVMEFCEGGSLRNQIGKLCDWVKAARVLSCAVQGLTGIHRAGGYHRDVKPDNLLLARDQAGKWIIKVSDFGLGRTPNPQSSTMTHSPGGTFGYMAPEIVAGGRYTPAADIYSLGVTIIELLTGERNNRVTSSAQVPLAFTLMLNGMTNANPFLRPNIANISASLYSLLGTVERAEPRQLAVQHATVAPVESPTKPGAGWLIGGGLALLALLAAGDDRKWDARVQRYRGTDGRFTNG